MNLIFKSSMPGHEKYARILMRKVSRLKPRKPFSKNRTDEERAAWADGRSGRAALSDREDEH